MRKFWLALGLILSGVALALDTMPDDIEAQWWKPAAEEPAPALSEEVIPPPTEKPGPSTPLNPKWA
ncbi:MAG TPA: hypothetical protein PKC28_04630, partial [Bdellovibrionales bacterium]|nr:hypothetical protein [Bdellovibrionales bacterium]